MNTPTQTSSPVPPGAGGVAGGRRLRPPAQRQPANAVTERSPVGCWTGPSEDAAFADRRMDSSQILLQIAYLLFLSLPGAYVRRR